MNDATVYMAGNGRMAAAYQQGNLVQLFGPPYSSPSILQVCLQSDTTCSSLQRLKKSGVWRTELKNGSLAVACMTDFVHPTLNCVVRHIESTAPVLLHIVPEIPGGTAFDYAITKSQTVQETEILLKTKNGNALYNDYPLTFPQFFSLIVRGQATVTSAGNCAWDVCADGEADLLFIGGPAYPECDETTEKIKKVSYESLLNATLLWWETQLNELTVMQSIPNSFPYKEQLAQAVEETAVNLTVQQSEQGGVLAGYRYPMGYVRDQFGVCMGLLKLGLFRQARRVLEFYAQIFRYNGKILNAQAMGVPGIFHFAENDASEIPGYLLLQFFRYAEIAKDETILTENEELLLWLYRQQLSQLQHGMLPFNGDETYIAGGLLPRDVIADGSAEATMLFLLSGGALLQYLKSHTLQDHNTLNEMERVLKETRSEYNKNFVLNGQYTLNNPLRTQGQPLPKYRYGVCMNLGKQKNCEFFGWTQCCGEGVYLCPNCLAQGLIPKKIHQLYHLPSALLMPAYLGAELLDSTLVKDYLNQLSEEMAQKGFIYSDEKQKKNVGYDYGLLLYNFTHYQIAHADLVFEKLLKLKDEAGAWSEYYIQDEHAGTRYRPWESAINIHAMITYAQQWKK